MSDQMETTNELCAIIKQRAEHGLKKYGVSLDRKDLTHEEWLQHLLEEVCDAGGYILAAQREAKSIQSALLAARSLLMSSHVQNNKFRMGALGAGDIGSAILLIEACIPDAVLAAKDSEQG